MCIVSMHYCTTSSILYRPYSELNSVNMCYKYIFMKDITLDCNVEFNFTNQLIVIAIIARYCLHCYQTYFLLSLNIVFHLTMNSLCRLF